MSDRIDQLPLLTQSFAKPRACPKTATKLARAIANKAARLDDQKKLRAWAYAVKDRDKWTDRKTGVRVLRTRQLDPLRAEAHHIEPRENKATRYDVRNGLCLSFATHYLIETNQLRIAGTQFFRTGGSTYIDATFPVLFVRL